MKDDTIKQYSTELYNALRQRETIVPLSDTHPGITIEDAYRISRSTLTLRESDGEVLVGKKIGVTSRTVQDSFNVYQPDFGFLTNRMAVDNSGSVRISDQLIQPKAEGEIAFYLKKKLQGPGVTAADVIHATEFVLPCIEIIDSRICDWKIKIEDTIADNASSGLFVLGDNAKKPQDIDFHTCGMVVAKNGEIVATGAGAAALGSPLNCVAWLANTLFQYDITLDAGDIILSGSLAPLVNVRKADNIQVSVGTLGPVSVRFE